MKWTKGNWRVEDNFFITAPNGKSERVIIAEIKGYEYFSAILGKKKSTEMLKANAILMSNAPAMFEFIRAIYEQLENNGEYSKFINRAENIIARIEKTNLTCSNRNL